MLNLDNHGFPSEEFQRPRGLLKYFLAFTRNLLLNWRVISTLSGLNVVNTRGNSTTQYRSYFILKFQVLPPTWLRWSSTLIQEVSIKRAVMGVSLKCHLTIKARPNDPHQTLEHVSITDASGSLTLEVPEHGNTPRPARWRVTDHTPREITLTTCLHL